MPKYNPEKPNEESDQFSEDVLNYIPPEPLKQFLPNVPDIKIKKTLFIWIKCLINEEGDVAKAQIIKSDQKKENLN